MYPTDTWLKSIILQTDPFTEKKSEDATQLRDAKEEIQITLSKNGQLLLSSLTKPRLVFTSTATSSVTLTFTTCLHDPTFYRNRYSKEHIQGYEYSHKDECTVPLLICIPFIIKQIICCIKNMQIKIK